MGIHERRTKLAPAATLWILAAAPIFAGPGSYTLSEDNEGLSAAVAAGMLRTGAALRQPRVANPLRRPRAP